MHGNVKEVCTRLMASFGEDSPVAVLVWTQDDVLASAGCMDITEKEADRVPELIAEDGDHTRYGIGRDTVRDMLTNLREEEALAREIAVPAAAPEKVMALAGEFLRYTDIESGEGAARRLYREESDALQRVREAVNR